MLNRAEAGADPVSDARKAAGARRPPWLFTTSAVSPAASIAASSISAGSRTIELVRESRPPRRRLDACLRAHLLSAHQVVLPDVVVARRP